MAIYVAVSEYHVFQSVIDVAAQTGRTKSLEYTKCLEHFMVQHNLEDCDEVKAFFKSGWTRFKRLKITILRNSQLLDKASKVTKELKQKASSEPPAEPQKKRRKSFDDLGSRMKNERIDSLLQQINEFTQQECPELTTTQLLGYLIHRINVQSEKQIAKVGHEIFTSSLTATRSFEVERSTLGS